MALKGRNFANKINGKPVINATRRVTLHISAKDTRVGNVKDPGACAAAKAAMREIPNCTAARIHLGRAYIFNNRKDQWMRFKTTDPLRTEIIAFDRGGKFQPGEYDLRPLSPTDLIPKKKYVPVSDRPGGDSSNIQKMPRKLHVVKGVRARGANR